MPKLSRSFYLRPTLEVARDLLGKFIVCRHRGRRLIGRIVEAEAYREGDPASHTFRGKTKRNEVMYSKGGHLYVYFTYGMHFCANVVTRKEGIGEAVLIRAVEPIEGIEVMMKNRFPTHHPTIHQFPPKAPAPKGSFGPAMRSGGDAPLAQTDHQFLFNLTNGPAKFCQAFGISREQNGTDLVGNTIYLVNGETIPRSRIGRSTRIGVTNGGEERWRFFVKGNEWVSR
jgi:DNA-3-methyladenine glycosylase